MMRVITSEMENAVNVAVDWWCDIITHPRMSSHIPTNDLYYILSVVKDKSFRNESVGAYIMSLNYVKDRKF